MERNSNIIGVSLGLRDGQTFNKSEMKKVIADVIEESGKILEEELDIL